MTPVCGTSKSGKGLVKNQLLGAGYCADEIIFWTPKREVIQQLDQLTATRSRLVKVRKMLQSPLTDSDGFLSKRDHNVQKKSCQKTLDALTQDIKQVQAEIAATIDNDPYLKELYGYVQSVKGIGPAIAT